MSEAIITRYYTEVLRRAPSTAEVSSWLAVTDSGLVTLDQALEQFVTSTEANTITAPLMRLYQAAFNRQPDAAGLDGWAAELRAGRTVEEVAENFAGSQEFINLYGAGSTVTTAYVTALYANVLGRVPSGAEVDSWVNSGLSRGQVMRGFSDSPEATARFAPAIDSVLTGLGEGTTALDPTAPLTISDDAVTGETLELTFGFDNLTGTTADDNFVAESGQLNSGDVLEGRAGADVLSVFTEDDFNAPASPRTTGIETFVMTNQTNDRFSSADNNVGGFDNAFEVDVEIDGGRMRGVNRWENFDSRADLVIEDARDLDDTDGTFTGDITVAMVSTDPGDVDYAVYFDGPTNTSQSFGTLELRVLDQEASAALGNRVPTPTSPGFLTESSLTQFTFTIEGVDVTVLLADQPNVNYGPNVTFDDLKAQVEDATRQALIDAGVEADFTATLGVPIPVGVGIQTTLPIILTFDVAPDDLTASPDNIVVRGRDSGNNNATDIFGQLSAKRTDTEELIRLNVELDDVGKGSMGGDAMFGAMSTGRQIGDQGTSDSIGIQQFDIEVDRSSQLQTISSTNNALEVVNIRNGENNGPNNTTTASDEQIGSLTVRGRANPASPETGTDQPMPGAGPQHNNFGFTDVRAINASAMVGSVDLTAILTSEVVEKYLKVEDTQQDGNADDVRIDNDNVSFDYALGGNNDAFLIAIDTDAIGLAGTGGREDFRMEVLGNGGNDTITTLVGDATKLIDGQGRDYYDLDVNAAEVGVWYPNHVVNGGASFSVDGGAGDDVIWTYGAGNFAIADGAGSDAIYTDNSGAENIDEAGALLGLTPTGVNALLSAFTGAESSQIDYVIGALWSFNDTGLTGNGFGDNQGANNEAILAATTDAAKLAGSTYVTELTVSYYGAGGLAASANGAYTSTVQIDDAVVAADGTVTDQTINQAIKRAINDNAVLSDLLEAVDAAGQSLFVYSNTDGVYVAGDLQISLTEKVTTAGNTTETDFSGDANFTKAYGTAGVETDFATFGTSLVQSDNLITMSADGAADTVVLGTGALSNDTLIYGAGQFGTDTVLNFGLGDGVAGFVAAEDAFDFTAISYAQAAGNFSQGAANQLNNSVSILAEANTNTDAGAVGNNNTAAKVADLFDGAADADLTTATTRHIVVVYDDNANGNATQPVTIADDFLFDSENNTGTVYLVTDTDGANATAEELGRINLIGQDWAALTFDNFA